MHKRLILAAAILAAVAGCTSQGSGGDTGEGKHEADVVIKTTAGDIGIHLYKDTPKHRENFLKLARENFFDGTYFHRIARDPNDNSPFVVQGGDPYSKNPGKKDSIGAGGPGYTLEAEIRPQYIHKRGAVAAARLGDQQNPFLRSSGSQFYIVTGKRITADSVYFFERLEAKQNMLKQLQFISKLDGKSYEGLKDSIARSNEIVQGLLDKRTKADTAAAVSFNESIRRRLEPIAREIEGAPYKPFVYTPEQRKAYEEIGGTPILDGAYTVFGEVVYGMDVVDKLQAAKTNGREQPDEPVTITDVVVK